MLRDKFKTRENKSLEEIYTLEIIKKNNFECNWTTLLIGRQFKIISSLEVMNYAIEYLQSNPDINDEDILELAWEHSEDEVDDLLEKIASDKSSKDKNKEYHIIIILPQNKQ